MSRGASAFPRSPTHCKIGVSPSFIDVNSLSPETTWHIQGHLLSNKVKVSTLICLTPRCPLSLCPEAVSQWKENGSRAGRKVVRGCCFRRSKKGLQGRTGDKVKERRGQAGGGLLVPACKARRINGGFAGNEAANDGGRILQACAGG